MDRALDQQRRTCSLELSRENQISAIGDKINFKAKSRKQKANLSHNLKSANSSKVLAMLTSLSKIFQILRWKINKIEQEISMTRVK